MTEKRFTVDKSPITHLFVPYDREKEFVFEGVENGNTIMKLVGLLNKYVEENKQLKSCFKASEESVEALRNINNKLEKENEKLLYEITEYKQAEYDNYNITDGLW